MYAFQMKIAGQTAAIQALFASTASYFCRYLSEDTPDFTITVTPQDLAFEQTELDTEALEEGLRRRVFTDPFLERAAIQRAFAEHLLLENTVMLHGSTIAVDGRAYLFTAKCGTGKSTHTRLWREVFGSRAAMINDDKPFLRIDPRGITAFGSPWSGKHGLDSNISAPLQGICILERGSENRIRPISPEETLPMLLHQSYRPLNPADHGKYEHCIALLSQAVPLWHMDCTISPQAAELAHAAMSAQR